MNSASPLRYYLTFRWLNKSDDAHWWKAWHKFFLSAGSACGFIMLVYASVPWGWWYLVWGPLALYQLGKFFGRYIVSWKGWRFKSLSVGFFICPLCRRLNPIRHMSLERVEEDDPCLCKSCFLEQKNAISKREMRQVLRKIDGNVERIGVLVRKQADIVSKRP